MVWYIVGIRYGISLIYDIVVYGMVHHWYIVWWYMVCYIVGLYGMVHHWYMVWYIVSIWYGGICYGT